MAWPESYSFTLVERTVLSASVCQPAVSPPLLWLSINCLQLPLKCYYKCISEPKSTRVGCGSCHPCLWRSMASERLENWWGLRKQENPHEGLHSKRYRGSGIILAANSLSFILFYLFILATEEKGFNNCGCDFKLADSVAELKSPSLRKGVIGGSICFSLSPSNS